MRSYIAVLPVLAAVVGAQIDPTSVTLALRTSWCSSQTSQCPLLCSQVTANHKTSTTSNTCDPKTLTYSCTCSGGITPNASEYSQTIPYFICTQVNENCVKACGTGNNACSSACRQDNPCGAQNPTVANTSSSTATSTSGASGSATAATTTGFGSFGDATATASTSSTKSAAIAALNLGNTYGVAVIAAGIFAGFGMML
ncbi:hypothetical protein EG328_003882 [Venturia inaequalis]|uniref:DUF7707 domain-containing protein n=1 Tax=Venturia inaequalis TaxID=5025 RepID=A0A8H3Z5T5_VENIN|nr:hypothetical protein EG328_003882 [Venturia inaequalis]KAE9987829.1 hypothetical protein EG327_003620 [Venturia inaequalis]RDI80303.1 hypothetical protein Vi05172_g9694 [Venturia inaequalis]